MNFKIKGNTQIVYNNTIRVSCQRAHDGYYVIEKLSKNITQFYANANFLVVTTIKIEHRDFNVWGASKYYLHIVLTCSSIDATMFKLKYNNNNIESDIATLLKEV